MKWNDDDDDDDDDQVIQMNRRQHQSAMLMLLNEEELCSLSCAKNISIEDFFCFSFQCLQPYRRRHLKVTEIDMMVILIMLK